MPQDGLDDALSPPPRTSIDDPGAHDLDSESSGADDHFSDALSGLNSPVVPVTRVEKVDTEPSYGEVPGTEAYKMRTEDAQPDEIAVITDLTDFKRDAALTDRPLTPGGRPIPMTVVEKLDTSSPSYGEVPGTAAYKKHEADAVPDSIMLLGSNPGTPSRSRAGSTPGDRPIPITKVERIDSVPRYGEVPGTEAYEKRRGDAEPDIIEEVEDVPGSPTSPAIRSPTAIRHTRRKSSLIKRTDAMSEYDENGDGDEDGFGDDFDDFEDGEEADFDDFEDGFQEPEVVSSPPIQSLPIIVPSFPVLNFDDLDTPDEVIGATELYMEAMFPSDTIDPSSLPPAQSDNPVFLTDRSASLWSQLVAPPPLQPPNWIRSRIRRLFLVSLGVPVDLDEILPASKQKKLILPSIHLHASPGTSSPRTSTSISRLKGGSDNASSTSLDSQNNPKPSSSSKRRKGPPPPPELDLVYARQLCTITDEALNGLTNEELDAHVKKLEAMQGTAKEVLEYWTKRTDEKIGDREAFEGVIENLVMHARKTRK